MSNIYWIAGNYFESRQCWDKLCSSIGDVNVQVFDCDSGQADKSSLSASDIILALKSRDIFDSRPRILKVKGIPPDYDLLTDYLKLSSPKNVLVFDGPVGYRKAGSKRLISLGNTKFFKMVKKLGEVHQFAEEAKTVPVAVTWVKKTSEALGKTIDPVAAQLLVQFKGKHLDTLYAEIVRLIDFQTGKKITESDVKECSAPLFLRQVWDLIDDMCAMNCDACLSHLQAFYDVAGMNVGTSFRGEMENLLGAFLKYFRFYLLIKDVSGGSLYYEKIKNACSEFKKQTKNEIPWEGEYFSPGFVYMTLNKESTKRIMQWPTSRVYLVAREIYQTRLYLRSNRKIKEHERGIMKLILNSLIMHVCGKLTYKHLETIRGS